MENKQQISVDDLVLGLYVVELDRPWLETPFLFQGFPITSREEIDDLRRHCRHVFVDPVRSDPAAVQQLSGGAAPARQSRPEPEPETRPSNVIPLPPRTRRERHRDVSDAFGSGAYPDDRRFRELLRIARGVRERSRAVVDRVFEDIRLGRSVQTEGARETVREMVETISENASASLWLTNLKKRDEYTSIHCINVCVLSIAFGRHMGMEGDELELLGLGALLHDVGKVRTPDAILHKPGRLTPDEFEVMKKHPVDGYEMMRAAGTIPPSALNIIRLHHERLAGHGYPDGLRGDDIPLGAMITALADVYDAMTSDRVYRGAMSSDQALRIMYRQAGTHYGQELMEEFIRCLGIFPVGSLVELSTGAIGVVITSDRRSRLRPVVALIRTPDGERYEKRVMLNLAALADDENAESWSIKRTLNPLDYDVDIAALVAAELTRR